ncbi:MFS transporter (plasmid) [Embleya sp. NBC_00888]|uniref:MFS transporter n=1 Tax=Embleya sp. NBC_00888 TaxID=2975960 RepID=UPI002F90B417|nr:MFS transporter [Embleya sp. NBC_00888]
MKREERASGPDPTAPALATDAQSASGRVGRASSGVLALACAAQFMVVLDVSVVNVALPSVRDALGFREGALPWVVNAYALVFAGFLLLGGRLADLYGLRRVFAVGLALFAGASLVGGFATSPAALVGARAAQGLGAAILAPATLTLVTTTFAQGPARTRALATWTAVGSAGGAAGNLIGGVLTQTLSWRWVLLINVPVGAIAIAAAFALLPPTRPATPSTRGRLDVPGAVLATVGVTALTYGVARGPVRGWAQPMTAGAVAAGMLALVAFAVVQARFAPAPLMPPRLWRVRAISVGNAVMLLAGACFIPMWYFLSLYMQNVLRYDALETGLGFLPHTLAGMGAARSAPWVIRRMDARTLILLGTAVTGAGFLWQSRSDAGSGYALGVLGPGIVMSAGVGLLVTPITATVTSGIDTRDAGAASGLMNTTRQLGGALGLAVLVAVAGASDAGRVPADPAADHGRVFLAMTAILLAVVAATFALPRAEDAEAGPTPREVRSKRGA